MKRLLLAVVSILMFLPLPAKTEGPVITVNGYEVSRSEFEYFLKKNHESDSYSKKDLKKYANQYIDFKLKVQAAVDAGLDKKESFLEEYRGIRNMQAESFMVDSVFLEDYAKSTYQESYKAIGPDGLSYMCIITRFPEDDSMGALGRAYALMDSIHSCLMKGEEFGTLANKYSHDNSAAHDGQVGWMAKSQLPPTIADTLFSLAPGSFSRPFIEDGVAVILYNIGHRNLGTYGENREGIYEFMREDPDIYGEAMRRKANAYSEKCGWGLSGDSAVLYMDSLLEEIEPEFGNLSREYHDGLLMYEICSQMIWEPALNDSAALVSFFESHRNEFWKDGDRFKGMVFFCKDEAVFHGMEKALEDLPIEKWVDAILAYNTNNSLVRVMRGSSSGIFTKGSNAYVDKLVFGEGSFEPMKNFPYANVIGKRLSSPENINDVSVEVSEAYQNSLEQKWVGQLRQKYKFKIHKKALYGVRP